MIADNGSVAGKQFADALRKALAEGENELREWVKRLTKDYPALEVIHPDDGWVDRDKKTVSFCYPQYMASPVEGSLCVLGWPDKYRFVRLLKWHRWVVALSDDHGHWDYEEVTNI